MAENEEEVEVEVEAVTKQNGEEKKEVKTMKEERVEEQQ